MTITNAAHLFLKGGPFCRVYHTDEICKAG
jgi:hypothetical protein